jgi:hypothetical protein
MLNPAQSAPPKRREYCGAQMLPVGTIRHKSIRPRDEPDNRRKNTLRAPDDPAHGRVILGRPSAGRLRPIVLTTIPGSFWTAFRLLDGADGLRTICPMFTPG